MYRIANGFIYSFIIALLAVLFTSSLWLYPVVLTILLFLLSVIMILLFDDKSDYYLFFMSGIGGTITEIIAIHFGAWSYSLSNIFGIPYWLFFLWGMAAIFIKRINLQINIYLKKIA